MGKPEHKSPMPTPKKQSVAEKLAKLEELLAWFESDDVTVEAALEKYKVALALAKDVEGELQNAKNQVEIIKKKFSDA